MNTGDETMEDQILSLNKQLPAPCNKHIDLGLEELTFKVLDAREQFSERTLAELYDPDKMPAVLRDAHHEPAWRWSGVIARYRSRTTRNGWRTFSRSMRR